MEVENHLFVILHFHVSESEDKFEPKGIVLTCAYQFTMSSGTQHHQRHTVPPPPPAIGGSAAARLGHRGQRHLCLSTEDGVRRCVRRCVRPHRDGCGAG